MSLNDTKNPELLKLIKWIDDPHRGKAAAVFQECAERQIACRFEILFQRLNPKIKP